jgi:N-acetylated-alpha-linked acidic dipeptidase
MQLPTSNEKATGTMADERTPLIQHVDVRPHRDRYPHHRLRLVCHTILSTVVLVGGLAAVILFSLGSFDDHHESAPTLKQSLFSASQIPNGWMHKTTEDYDELQSILLNTPDAEQARLSSRYYSGGPHLAGKNLSQALWTMEKWQSYGIASSIVDYDVYINYPKSHRLALLGKNDNKDDANSHAASEKEWEVTYEAKLEENVLEEDKSSQLVDRVPTFHGYSASGNVTAPYVFVNYGTFQDFEDLRAANVSLEGKIALVKYFGGNFRGLKVKRAQEMGMIGCVMYSDPGDDGDITEEKGLKPYPEGPAREPSSVQRGSVQFLSMNVRCLQ